MCVRVQVCITSLLHIFQCRTWAENGEELWEEKREGGCPPLTLLLFLVAPSFSRRSYYTDHLDCVVWHRQVETGRRNKKRVSQLSKDDCIVSHQLAWKAIYSMNIWWFHSNWDVLLFFFQPNSNHLHCIGEQQTFYKCWKGWHVQLKLYAGLYITLGKCENVFL